MKRSVGLTLLGIWLIATALLPLIPILFPGMSTLLSLLAFAAGLLILIGR